MMMVFLHTATEVLCTCTCNNSTCTDIDVYIGIKASKQCFYKANQLKQNTKNPYKLHASLYR